MSIRTPLGIWRPVSSSPVTDAPSVQALLGDLASPVVAVRAGTRVAFASGGRAELGGTDPSAFPLLAYLPPLRPDQLGDPTFLRDHGVKYPYMTGAMANGIASAELVEAIAKVGMLGSFGAAGLSIDRVAQAIDRLHANLGGLPFAINLIHSPNEPAHEAALADLLMKRRVTRVEASAYLDLTPAIVRYRLAGLSRGPDGKTHIGNRVIAKVSRVEVATRFLSPAPAKIVQELLSLKLVTQEQAELSATVPMCDDLTGEADSGGHTDNRPAITLLPTLIALRDRFQRQYRYDSPVRVGLAGGIATPAGVAGAFALGAAYVVTGSINQACVESGSSDVVRKMLAEAGQADVIMAPAADMFEMGVKLQVLKRGTMFAMRAQKLFELYRGYPNWEAIPQTERVQVEKNLLRASFEEIWNQTREFFQRRDPTQLAKAETDGKHRMALVFRWYLGLSSRWANAGEASRQLDYQIWCGPAMGAFNEWAKGTDLEAPTNRRAADVAVRLMQGACLHLRMESLRQQGISNAECGATSAE
jgi:trans-AT polyketide synthase, acyltransferase and oxidoreductase domains